MAMLRVALRWRQPKRPPLAGAFGISKKAGVRSAHMPPVPASPTAHSGAVSLRGDRLNCVREIPNFLRGLREGCGLFQREARQFPRLNPATVAFAVALRAALAT